MALDHGHCFLCGVELNDDNRTDEHVFPRWMLRDFDLWNTTLHLLNATDIRYAQLTIPSCGDCNSFWLARVEQEVAAAFRAGSAAVKALDPTLLCLWMAKVYYGIHFKELALRVDRSWPGGPTIVPTERLAQFTELHQILQAMRRRVRFDRVPGSIRVFRAQVPEDVQHRFDYRDLRAAPFLAIRAAETVVIASLLDWGAMNAVTAHPFDVADQLDLHPVQFAEVAAFGACLAVTFNRRFAYAIEPRGDHDVIEPIIVEETGSDRNRSPFEPFDVELYARVFGEFVGLAPSEIYFPDDGYLWSNLRRPDGSPLVMTLAQAPPGTLIVPPGWPERHPDIAAAATALGPL